MAKNTKRTAVLVLGMHRSGTSALTRALNIAGYALPESLMGASEGNETGHWESANIAAFNDGILQELGLSWRSWEPANIDRLSGRQTREILEDMAKNLRLEFPGTQDFVLKDPRMCRFATLYIEALGAQNCSPHIILPIRNPLEVTASLHKRDQMNKGEAALLWLRHVLDAEKQSRGHNRAFCTFEGFLSDWRTTLNQIIEVLSLKPSQTQDVYGRQIDAFLNADLKHHFSTSEEVTLDPLMRGWIDRAYGALLGLCQDPNNQASMDVLDSIGAELDHASPLMGHMAEAMSREHQQENEDMALSLADKTDLLEQKDQTLVEVNALYEDTNKKLHKAVKDYAQLEKISDGKGADLKKIAGDYAQLEKVSDGRSVDLKIREGQLVEQEKIVTKVLATLEKHARKIEKFQNANKAILAANKQKDVEIKQGVQAFELHVETIDDLEQQLIVGAEEKQNFVNNIDGLEQQLVVGAQEKQNLVQDIEGLSQQYHDTNMALLHEKTTVFRPAARRFRRLIGKILRTVLPTGFVNKLALLVPTRAQKQQMQHTKSLMGTPQQINVVDIHQLEQKNTKPDIFVLAIIGWHFRTQRPQHIARELAARGRRVFYFEMDPPGKETEIEQVAENLYRVKLKLENCEQIPAYVGVPNPAQEKAWLQGFYKFCDDVNATAHKEMIIQHPFWWQLAKLLPPAFRHTYDCMDDVAGFDNSTPELIKLEHGFLTGCDQLIVSGQTLFDKYKKVKPPTLIRNATEIAPFENPDLSALKPEFIVRDLSDKPGKIKIGYVGAIADWYDVKLLQAVARKRPEFEFHLCGNVSADGPQKLQAEPNIHMYGEIPYVQVPAFLAQMDVLIIPFKIIPIIRACDPVKFYEYCALGKPTVSTPLPELDRAKHLAFIANGPDEFCDKIDQAYAKKDDKKFIRKLKDFAKENTWQQRAEQFDAVLSTYPKISVVVLAYGDPQLTIATLHSLKTNGGVYPNMEILVVDNGSPAEAIATMADYAKQFPDVKIIENGENLGFAAGNNVGLEQAQGDYVLLLNNDTYVAPGSLYAMVRHLQQNPTIGAVGPLTNNIGNEARVEVDYEDMAAMAKKARALTTGYRGQNFETRIVAYFAVMFRAQDLENFGHLSLDYGRGMFEDDDHCHVIKSKNYSCAVAEDAFIHHHLSATFSQIDAGERQALFDKNKKTFEKKWGVWQAHKYRKQRGKTALQFDHSELS